MEEFIGNKYVLISNDDIHVLIDMIEEVIPKIPLAIELRKAGLLHFFVCTFPERITLIAFEPGMELQIKNLPSLKIKTTITLCSNMLHETIKFSSGKTITAVYIFSNTELKINVLIDGVVVTIVYRRKL